LPRRHRFRIALLVVLLGWPGVAAALPAVLAQRIAESAQASPEPAHAALARDLGNPQLAAAAERAAAEHRRASLHAVVIESIATHPALAGEIVAAAARAAPDLADDIAADAKHAFPGFAATIDAARGTPTAQLFPPTPAAAAAPAPAPKAPETAEERDPWEGVNRAIFAVNDTLDIYLFKPVAQGYGALLPEPAKEAVRRLFGNLASPAMLANDLLQFELGDAAVTTGRFVINSTVGLAGLFDPASRIGLEKHPSDFGQTLNAWGIASGPYLMAPVLGPTTIRHLVGRGVDGLFNPLTYFLDPIPRTGISVADGLTLRERVIEPLDTLRATSIDYYAAIRSLYFQDRAAVLRRGQPPKASELDVLFESTD